MFSIIICLIHNYLGCHQIGTGCKKSLEFRRIYEQGFSEFYTFIIKIIKTAVFNATIVVKP